MHVTLHLTNNCNLACTYCYVDRANIKNMSEQTARAAVDLANSTTIGRGSVGVIFFGGEPLLHKELIYKTVEYAKSLETSERYFHYKITTNGTLLDDEFLKYSQENNIFIALSLDGVQAAHNKHRVDIKGEGTFGRVSENAKKLLAARPYAPVMMTVNPDTVEYFAESVSFLYDLGFHYIISSLNYTADWTEEDMLRLEKQYKLLADWYYKMTVKEEKFYLSPFEVKISSHINRNTYVQERCELGKKQISVAPDGTLFPCVQFVGDEEYAIGNVFDGVDEDRRERLYQWNEEEKETCTECAVRKRCNHYCGCLNKQTTGHIDQVSPVQCAHERLLLPIADKLAAKLFGRRSAMFIQKHYNDLFPLVSAVEDKAAGK